jgi:hypothetical protein
MKLRYLIPCLALGAALAASAQTAAPGQPTKPKPKDAAINGLLHPPGLQDLRLNPGTLPQIVEQLQMACSKAAAENAGSREAAAEGLRKARAFVARARVQNDEELEHLAADVRKAQADAEAAKAAAKSDGATEKEMTQKELAEANLERAQTLAARAEAAAEENMREALDVISRYQMPTVTYGPGSSEARVSATLDLAADVRPLDALALIAAAAGCNLNPVYAPPQDSEIGGQRIIGYIFEPSYRSVFSSTPMNHPVSISGSGSGSTLAISPDGANIFSSGSTGNLHGGDTTATYSRSPASGAASPSAAGKTVPAPIAPPAPLTTSGAGSPKPIAAPSTSVSTPSGQLDSTTGRYMTQFIPQEIDVDAQVVRIYALGPILGGNDPNGDAHASKEKDFQDLIQEAMDVTDASGPRPPAPKLYFHDKSRVLIAKATLRQQEIIEQAINAVRNNEGYQPMQKPK